MLMNIKSALCEVKAYFYCIPSTVPVAFLSDELYNSFNFTKPNFCELVVKNNELKVKERYEFYVLPSAEEKGRNYSWYNDHTISIPSEIYHQILGFEENKILEVRTDILPKIECGIF